MLNDKRKAGLLGLLMGDACGVPFEFYHAQDLDALPAGCIDYPPNLPDEFRRAHAQAPHCAWSDDGAMALALLHSLRECGGLDLADLSQRFLAWKNQGHYSVNGCVFDIGNQVKRGLSRVETGGDPRRTGPALEADNGNGALMRVLPVALWHQGSDEHMCQIAQEQGLPTHGHLRSQVACALYCLWARQLLNGAADGFDEAVDRLFDIYEAQENDDALKELDFILSDEGRAPRGSGYVVDTLWSARKAFLSSDKHDDVVRAAIALGNDCDTTAAVAGGLAGLRSGMAGLSASWLSTLPSHPALTESLAYLDALPNIPAPRRGSTP